MSESVKRYDSIIIGGGMAGLTTAALLAKRGQQVLLLEKGPRPKEHNENSEKERSPIFDTFAVSELGKEKIGEIEKKLELSLPWSRRQKRRTTFLYDQDTFSTIFKIKSISLIDKMKFCKSVYALHTDKKIREANTTISEWLQKEKFNNEIQTFLFNSIRSAYNSPAPDSLSVYSVISHLESLVGRPQHISFLRGGSNKMMNELTKSIESNGGEITYNTHLIKTDLIDGKVVSVTSSEGQLQAGNFVFCIPPHELDRTFNQNVDLNKFSEFFSTYATFYDVVLETNEKPSASMFIDFDTKTSILKISRKEHPTLKEGTYLYQGVAFWNGEKNYQSSHYKEKIEKAFDSYIPGWRRKVVSSRTKGKIHLQSVRWNSHQQKLPVKFVDCSNAFFAGDWCEGDGDYSSIAFSTALKVSNLIKK